MNGLVFGGGAWTDLFAGVTGCGRVAGGLVGHVHGVEAAVLIKQKRENRDQAGRRAGDLTKRGGRVRAEAPVSGSGRSVAPPPLGRPHPAPTRRNRAGYRREQEPATFAAGATGYAPEEKER